MTTSAGLRPVIDRPLKPGREQIEFTPGLRAELRAKLDAGLAEMHLKASDKQKNQLIESLAFLSEWNAVINLTAIREPHAMLAQHVLDSLSVLHFIPKEATTLLDVGPAPGTIVGVGTVVIGLLLVGTACGGGSDAADGPTTTASGAGGGDVDVDAKDGTVKYTDESGNETEMNLDGSGAALPKGWPSALAPSDAVTIVTSNTSTIDGDDVLTVLGETTGSIGTLQAGIERQIDDAGYDLVQTTSADMTGGGYAGMTATKGDNTLVVAIARDPSAEEKVTLTMTLTTKR